MAAMRALSRAFAPHLRRSQMLLSCSQYRLASSEVASGEIGEVSGIPPEHLHRRVLIFNPARTASQQGLGNTKTWKISFDSTEKWENPLMGWTSTADPLANVGDSALYFDSKEAAMEFARKHGWKYEVREPKQMVKKPKAYADNFKWKGPSGGSDE